MRRIQVIGAGQLGSRHLQALKAISEPLQISVVDPSEASLNVAKERYDSVASSNSHQVDYGPQIRDGEWDLVIVATNAKVRRKVVKELLSRGSVKYLVLEKILFTEEDDYIWAPEFVKSHGTQAWVNCCMRMMPIYQTVREQLKGAPVAMSVSGSQYGLVTNAIHYLDYLVWLTGQASFDAQMEGLIAQPINSKRVGYLEFNGTITACFENRNFGSITCFGEGALPGLVEIHSSDRRFLIREWERKAWVSEAETEWKWREIDAIIPYQSQLTTILAEGLFNKGRCDLPTLEESSKTHLSLLRPLASHLQKQGYKDVTSFPFT